MWLLSGFCLHLCLCGGHMTSTKCSPSRELLLPMWHTDPSYPAACSWGFTLFPHQSTARHWAPAFLTLCSTVYRILVVLKPSPFFPSMVLENRFLVQSPESVFTLFLYFSPATSGGVFFLHHPGAPHSAPFPFPALSLQKQLPILCGFSLPVHFSTLCSSWVLWFRLCRLLC